MSLTAAMRLLTPLRIRRGRLVLSLGFVLGFGGLLGGNGSAFAEEPMTSEPESLKVDRAEDVRIAVAPFEGETAEWPAAGLLSEKLASRPLTRLIKPAAFVADRAAKPSAADVRQWAYNAAVDSVVVGEVRAASEFAAQGAPGGREIEAVVRSGHSGAELSRHLISLADARELPDAADQLAEEILASFGLENVASPPPGMMRDPRSPEPPRLVAGPESGDVAGADSTGDESESPFDFGGLGGDSPIEIKADEAEIVDRGQGRTLLFQRNVRVRQGDITLASDRLEAQYQKGQSEPDRLVAQGKVAVGQGHRRAKCDRAIYLRVEQRLSCEGRAELVQGCDIVRGNSIEFDLASEKARVIGAASIVIRPGEATERGCESSEDVL